MMASVRTRLHAKAGLLTAALCALLASCDFFAGSWDPLAAPTVYAGGYSNSGSVDVAGYWKNGTWVGLENPAGDHAACVDSLVVYGSDVYAGGYSNNGSVDVAGYWKNGTWVGLATNPPSDRNTYTGTLLVSDSDVYVGGFARIESLNVAGYWKNGTWVGLANPAGAYSAQLLSLIVLP